MTAPLVPPDITIPRLPWVPVYADRLWESKFFAVATDAEFKAAFCLWLKSWNQKPPGSLPNDDRLLCRLAELSGNPAKWRKVKRIALRHWVECDDGRLYHPVVSELVLDANEKLQRSRERTSAATANRWKSSNSNNRNGHRNGVTDGRKISVDGGDLNRTVRHPLNPLRDEGDKGFSKNGLKNGAAGPAPMDPRILHHADPCHCDNCTRWAEQQRTA
jgi:hypothetical protein